MAASASPSPSGSGGGGGGGDGANRSSNGNSAAGQVKRDNSAVAAKMKHNPGIATEWSADEQAILDDGMKRYASEANIVRYAKIAMQLPKKTIRDVALRCIWMNKKEISKRRKDENWRKNKDKGEKLTDPSSKSRQPASWPTMHTYSLQSLSFDNDDDISYKAIGDPIGELIEQNAQTFEQISANFATHQIQENISLLCRARDNIMKIMNSLSETPEVMSQMPPLPVKVNEELANSILPRWQS